MLKTRIPLLTARFLTPGFATLGGLALTALLGKVVTIYYEVLYNQSQYMTGLSSYLALVAIWLSLSFLAYQVRFSITLDSAGRRAVRRYTIFGVIFFRKHEELDAVTWVQPKTAYLGSKKFVIDAGNATEINKTHFIEMPADASWSETVKLGILIAEELNIECRPYSDKLKA